MKPQHLEPHVRLQRARNYPYAIPQRSFVYRDGAPTAFDARLLRGRTPVLAIGSNQSPERLAQKFGHDASHVIPVQRARLADFDVVFCAHIASYGAVPAMLQTSPGAEVSVAVTWLDDVQLAIMHASEMSAANYLFAELLTLRLTLDDGSTAGSAFAYVTTRGHLSHEGAPVALSAIDCAGRRYDARTTGEALELVRERVAPDAHADAFVHRLVTEPHYRRQVTERLAEDAGAFEHPLRRVE
jgi:hypothetical protein